MRLPKEMRQSFILMAFVFAMTGCNRGHSNSDIEISPIFSVCIRDTGERYILNRSKIVDWDDGVLLSNKRPIDVYIGEHPDFQRSLVTPPKTVSEGFAPVGAQVQSGMAKALYVETSGKRPVYVMFQSKDVGPEALLERTKAYEIKYCTEQRK